MVANFLKVLFFAVFFAIFALCLFNLITLKRQQKIIEQKRKARNERFATIDKYFETKSCDKKTNVDDDVFASIEEEI